MKATHRFQEEIQERTRPGTRPARGARGEAPAAWPGRLNSFQRMMRNWEDVHPYVAVHILKLPRPLPHALLVDSVKAVLAEAGLTSISLDARGRYRWGEFPFAPEIVYLRNADPLPALQREAARQLNQPFPPGPHCPFRFFVLSQEARTISFLGMTYHHLVADAHSAALVLRRILGRALGRGADAVTGALNLYPPAMRDAFPSGLALRRAPALMKGILRDFFRYKRAFAMDYQSSADPSVGFRIGAERIPVAPAKAFAKECGGTLQDLVFACTLEALARRFPLGGERRGWRRNLMAAAAMDLRRFAEAGLENAFGQFLGSYAVGHDVPPGCPLGRLVADVAAQSRHAKERGYFFGHVWSFAAMDLLWPLFGPGLKRSYSKWAFPLAAGVSNMNISPVFEGLGVPFYLRAASTGPIMPLLVDVTTVDGALSLTAMFRRSAFSEEAAREITDHIGSRLKNPWSAIS